MASMSTHNRSVMTLTDDAVTVYAVDGSEVHLPRNVLRRSSLLSHALADTHEDGHTSLCIPIYVLEAWLDGLKLLGIGAGSEQSTRAAAKVSRVAACTRPNGILECLKV